MQASTRRSGPSGNLPPAPRRSAIAYAVWLAVGSATLTLAAPRPTLAQAAAQQAPGMRQSHDIPAGPLAPALRSLAGAANMLLTFTAEQTNGKTTTGIRGQYTPEEALAALLAHSGLHAVKLDNGGYVLRAAPAPVPAAGTSEATLPAVRVTAVADAADARDGTTEHTGSYTTRSSSTATKLNLSPRETPQTLTVVTRQKMDDFKLDSVNDVLQSTSGVFLAKSGDDGNYLYSRGFNMQSQYDGMPNLVGLGDLGFSPVPDTSFLDKVEILQGASGLVSGAGDAGGVINLVRKRPTEDFQSHIEAQIGSWNKRRLVGDISSPLNPSKSIRGRAVAFIDDSDSFVDYVFYRNKGFYGIVEADVTPNTKVAASVMYLQSRFNDFNGVPRGADGSDLHLPRSSFYGLAQGGGERESTTYTLDMEHRLPSDWKLKAAYSHSSTDADRVFSNFASGPLDAATGNGLLMSRNQLQAKLDADILDMSASGPFEWFGRKHEMVLGLSGAELNQKNRLQTASTRTPVNIYDYDAASISLPSNPFRDWPVPNKTMQQGVYGTARLSLSDSIKMILGGRVSWYEYKYVDNTQRKENSVVTPYAGLIFDVARDISFYGSYSDIFKPQSNLKADGGTIDPIVGKNYELGIKGDFLQGRLSASAALFRLEQTNLGKIDYDAEAGACNGGYCYKAAGLVISEGIDVGLNGEIMPAWSLGMGYTYSTRKYGKDGDGIKKGDPYLEGMPDQIFRIFSTYKIPSSNWMVGANLRAQSSMQSKGSSYVVRQGSYAIVGMSANYKVNNNLSIGLAVSNLFDRRYYEAIGSATIYNFYGAPRSFAANLKYNF